VESELAEPFTAIEFESLYSGQGLEQAKELIVGRNFRVGIDFFIVDRKYFEAEDADFR